jgi:putative molybdopterin biosynthesis protein
MSFMTFRVIFLRDGGKENPVKARSEFYTKHELAALLRVKERKVYDFVAKETLPFQWVTGKSLFPRDEIAQELQVNGVANDASPAVA